MATKQQAKKLAKQLNLKYRKGLEKFDTFGGDESGCDVIRYFKESGEVSLYQTCFNCGDGHSTNLTKIAETL